MAFHNDLGKLGEALAKDYLVGLGYEVLDENWVFGKAELDLIVYKDGLMVFVEVKSRSSNAFGEPEDFVERSKQQQMELAASAYIDIMNHQKEIRFDVVAIIFNKNNSHKLNHIEDAFWPED